MFGQGRRPEAFSSGSEKGSPKDTDGTNSDVSNAEAHTDDEEAPQRRQSRPSAPTVLKRKPLPKKGRPMVCSLLQTHSQRM